MAKRKNYLLDPDYITVNISAYTNQTDDGTLPIVAIDTDTGKKIGRFVSLSELATWAKKLGGKFELDAESDDSGHGHFFEYDPRAAEMQRKNRLMIHGCAALINSLPADYF